MLHTIRQSPVHKYKGIKILFIAFTSWLEFVCTGEREREQFRREKGRKGVIGTMNG